MLISSNREILRRKDDRVIENEGNRKQHLFY